MPADAARIAEEGQKEAATPVDVPTAGLHVGALSASRGVTIGFLLAFTERHDAWDWTSWDLILKVVIAVVTSISIIIIM